MRAAISYKWTRAESNRRLNRFAFVVLSARSLLWLLVPSPEDRRLYTEPCSSRLLPSLSQGHLMCTPQVYQDLPRGVRSELRSDGVRAVVDSYVGAVLTGQRPAHIQRQVTDPSIPVAPVLIGRGITQKETLDCCVWSSFWVPRQLNNAPAVFRGEHNSHLNVMAACGVAGAVNAERLLHV